MANYYKGDEIKFAIAIEAPGFNMDEDDFDIEVKSGNTSVKAFKTEGATYPQGLIIFKETPEQPEDEEEVEEETEGVWYAIVDTSYLATGNMRVIATAHIADANANDGIRNSIAVRQLGKLENP